MYLSVFLPVHYYSFATGYKVRRDINIFSVTIDTLCGVAIFHASMLALYTVISRVCTVVLSLHMQCVVYVYVLIYMHHNVVCLAWCCRCAIESVAFLYKHMYTW